MKMRKRKLVSCLLAGAFVVCTAIPTTYDVERTSVITAITASATNSASDIINVASDEVGNGLSKYTQWNGKIGNTYTYAWCAAFTSWCAYQAGVTSVSKTASCYNQYHDSSGKKHWVVNDKSYIPQAGDLIYFDWSASGSTNTNFDHVGIVVSYNSSTKKITTIEGNYGNNGSANNKVTRTTRDYNNKVKAFLTPNYVNPDPWVKETGWNLPVTVTAPSKISNLYNLNGGSDSGHYIDKGDKCTIDEVWVDKLGVKYVHVQYPISGGNRWSYAKLSDLPITLSKPVVTSDKSNYSSGDTAKITWKAVSGATDYWINIWKDGTSIYSAGLGNKTSYNLNKLTAGKYGVFVTAYNDSANNINEVYNFYVVPAIPVGKFVSGTSDSVKFSWGKVAGASGYKITWRSSDQTSAEYSVLEKNVTALNYTKTGLDPNKKYFFRVYAINETGGESARSETINTRTAPVAPTAKVDNVTTNQAKISWNKVAGATRYEITFRPASEENYQTIATNVTDTSYTKTGLQPNTKYYFRVYAINDLDSNFNSVSVKSARSETVGVTTQQVKPDTPVGKFVSGTSDSVKFSWGKVAGASGYKITWRSSDQTEYSVLEKNITALNYTKTGLDSNKKYFFRVYALSATGGESARSETINTRTAPVAPVAKVDDVTTNQAKISWNKVAGATRYEITFRPASEENYQTIATNVTETNYTKTGLQPNTKYYFRVYAINDLDSNFNSVSVKSARSETVGVTTKQTEYTVTFNENGGKVSPANKKVTYDGQYGELPTPSKQGYTFNGWFTAKSGGTKITADSKVTITANQTLYAQWEKNKLAMCYNANGGTLADNSEFYLDKNSNVLRKSDNLANLNNWDIDTTSELGLYNATSFKLTREGYQFLGWSLSPDGGKIYDQDDGTVTAKTFFPDIVTKSGKVVFYAQWKRINYTGDLTNDGKISVNDTILMQKYLHNKQKFTQEQYQIADMNGDGKINVIDLALLKQKLLKK